MFGGTPIIVLSQNTKRESGRKVQLENVSAGKTIADVIRTCLGPQAMLKMLMDPMGGIVMTNDGNAILREITVQHPAAKTMIEIARAQDEEVGDGTTSVIILTGEVLFAAEPFLHQQVHPMVIIKAYRKALDDILDLLGKKFCIKLDVNDRDRLVEVVEKCIGTKFIGRWSSMACRISLDAVQTVLTEENGKREIDLKRYVRIEKVPGGRLEESQLLDGIMLNKDITHPKMRRYIENPRIVLLDCSLEYKKGESQTNVEIVNENDFTRLLQLEEEYVQKICSDIVAFKPDLVFTEKGISDLAQHYLAKANVTAIRRLRKTDNNRLARATGARIVSRTEELKEEDVGTGAGLFEIKKFGDEYFTFITKCKNPKACTILLRGPSKDILNEAERNLQDALHVAKNIMIDPRLVLGGGCVEMNLSRALLERSKTLAGIYQGPYQAIANALTVIPRTLAHNCGQNMVKTLTELHVQQAKHGKVTMGVDGITGEIIDVKEAALYDPFSVKQQVYKTAIETAILLLKIDDIVSGSKKKDKDSEKSSAKPTEESLKE